MAPSAVSTPPRTHFPNGHNTNGIATLHSQLYLNGHSNGQKLSQSSPDELLDLLCVGFGPASLAIAIALHDSTSASSSNPPKALFLEKQSQFAWHAGMQLPGAKMQISFLKDLATPRDPRSKFTFINYLFSQGRLNHFINLSTFLPTRIEYEDYLRWCAKHFEREGKVAYGMEVEGVSIGKRDADGKVTSWEVSARDATGEMVIRRARHVVIAVGGRPVIPKNLQGLKHVAHSSQFANTIPRIREMDVGIRLRFAVVGSGQSAAEIFNDLSERFPNAEVKLIIKGASLRPSDDSPL
jgi:L-ornithine N5-oxygenase